MSTFTTEYPNIVTGMCKWTHLCYIEEDGIILYAENHNKEHIVHLML